MELNLHDKQVEAFLSPANEILYGGAAGGGKSHLMRVFAIYCAITIPNLQVYLFRRKSEDLKKNHLEGAGGFRVLLKDYVDAGECKINDSLNQIVFSNNARIHLCHCQHEKDVYNYQGAEIHLLLIDELTHFTEFIYKFLRGRVRLGGLKIPDDFPSPMPKIICGSNPGGIGHDFVKETFINAKNALDLYQMPPMEGGMIRQFIPAKLDDNPTMTENDPLYKYKLMSLGGSLAEAMLDGNWDCVEGAFFDSYSKTKHVLSSVPIPKHWYRVRAFDWGYSRPFCVLWGAVSDGDIVKLDGVDTYIPKGAIVIYREYYGCTGKANVGLKLTASEIAEGVNNYQNGEEIGDMVADPAIFDQSSGKSIAEQMAEEKVYWRKADNKRMPGWQQIRERLKGIDDKPLLFIFDTCKHLLRTLPIMIYDISKPEDIDTDLEDHAVDTLRYLCMSRPITRELKVEERVQGINIAKLRQKLVRQSKEIDYE